MSKQPTVFEGKRMKLIDVPVDIQKIIISRQEEEKEDCLCERSQDHAIYKMLREHHQTIGQDKILCITFNGRFLSIENFDVSFDGFNIKITSSVPLDTGLGLALNYKRLEKEHGENKED